jgi:predicted AAA+ superfamily ATPase
MRVVAISGPRLSGKTTLARRFAQQGRNYLTLDNQPTLAAARNDPVAFIRGLDRANCLRSSFHSGLNTRTVE